MRSQSYCSFSTRIHPHAKGNPLNTLRFQGGSPVTLLESLYLVEVMHPSQSSKKSQFNLVLGSSPLTQLADAIYCRNHEYLKEFGLHSKMMYIANKFIVDKRDATNVDYSMEVRWWLQKFPALRPDYPGYDVASVSMAHTSLSALPVQLDTPYLFVHVGACEHVLYIRNIRLMHNMDTQSKDEYPMRLTKRHHHQKCLVCQVHVAKLITFGDPMAVDDPMYYCDSCYYVAHYDANGNLMPDLADYQVFPHYPDD
ncbi:hypothetical protein DYB32_001398 [Aphanomyces invadans]|uniref:snRNA-activating protein complex subunit 3 n=1 Tax=Aphanomyces invadans TaxID=157072 RepID=A0A418B6Q1_9STRA|nr:hypothetical protein DYB32_001398 [Aphanomyces invadans]